MIYVIDEYDYYLSITFLDIMFMFNIYVNSQIIIY